MILIKFFGKIYSYYISLTKRNIFKSRKGKEYLQMYAESELKLLVFKTHAKLKGLRLINEYVDSKKKSDTVFILGSGESVNDLTKQDWNYIKEHNIIGLNYSFIHPVIPDYHFMEMIPLKEMQEFFCKITREKYKDVDMFFQYKHVLKSEFDLTKYEYSNRMYVHVPHLYPTIYSDILELYFLDLKKKKKINFSHLVHHNSHIGCAVMFAQLLGYKKIIMLGIDLNGGNYFTDSKTQSKVFPQNSEYKIINNLRKQHFDKTKEYKNSIHPTIDQNLMKNRGGIMMDEYFKVYNKVFLMDSDTKLFSGSVKSKLSNFLPVFEFGKK
jgi:hypothetical protein